MGGTVLGMALAHLYPNLFRNNARESVTISVARTRPCHPMTFVPLFSSSFL